MANKGFIAAALVAILGYGAFKYLDTSDTPVVTTSNGNLVGFVSRSREGKEFFQFLGIPYAKKPERFEPPQPADTWEGVRKAKRFGNMCIHVNSISRVIEGDEDCLYLNVFTPKFTEKPDNGSKGLPVFVYIHGGYFMAGGSNYMGPYYLMEEQIILVTINYRLASLGFLNTGEGTVLGNMGMKDQVMALQFVKNEIANFGGDPKNVILWGESAGAAAVHFHLLSSMSKGLFKKAIISSGTAIKPWSLVNEPEKQALHFGKMLNCPTENVKLMIQCLKDMDSRTLIGAHMDALDTPIMDALKIFAPSIEIKSRGSDAFLTEHPYDILKQGKSHRVPVLTGVNSHEGLLATARIYYNPPLIEQVENEWNSLSPIFFYYDKTHSNVTDKIKDFYFGDTTNKLNFMGKFLNITAAFSDRLYIHSMKETVRLQAKHSPVYLYYFSYPLQRGLTFFYDLTPPVPIQIKIVSKVISEWVYKTVFGTEPVHLGTCHGDELVLFYNFPMVYIDVGHRDYEISRQMIKAFIQFAYDESLLTVGETQWSPVNLSSPKARLKYMYFGNDSSTHATLIDEPFAERMDFWDSLNLPWKMNHASS